MAIKNENEIKQLVNTGENGFHEAIGENIRTFSRFIQTSSDRNAAEHNPKSYSSPGGHYLAEMDNLRSSAVGIRKIHLRRLAVFCVRLAAAPYEGKEISFEVHRFSPDNPIDRQCIQDLKKREDWKNAPEQILQMKIGGLVCGSFIPEWKCFLPAAGFQDTSPYGQSLEEYLQSNPHVRSRCRALVETMLANGAYPDVFRELLDDLGDGVARVGERPGAADEELERAGRAPGVEQRHAGVAESLGGLLGAAERAREARGDREAEDLVAGVEVAAERGLEGRGADGLGAHDDVAAVAAALPHEALRVAHAAGHVAHRQHVDAELGGLVAGEAAGGVGD